MGRNALKGDRPSRVTRRRLLAGAGSLVAAAAVSPLLPRRGESAAGDASSGVVNMAVAADCGGLDPTSSTPIWDRMILNNCYDALVTFAPTTFDLRPALAERWTISPDGKVYTFVLRRNARFWDGTPVKSDAVKFSFERQIDKNNPDYQYAGRTYIGRLAIVDHVEAPDDYTLKIALKRPSTPFLQFLTDRMGWIVEPKLALALRADFEQKGMGSGQFKVDAFQHNVRTAMSPNPYYWGPRARLRGLNFVVIPEPQAQVAALQSGTVNIIFNPDPDLLPALQQMSNLAIQRVVASHAAYLCLNQRFKPLQDVRVRRAFDLGINKHALVDTLLRGVAVVAKTPLSEAYGPYYLKDFPNPRYDAAQARRLLTEAGYGSGLDVRLLISSNSSGTVKAVEQATAIQADLAKISVRVKIQTYDVGTATGILTKQHDAYDMALSSYSSVIGDPDNLLSGIYASYNWPPNGWNYSFYKNPEVDRWLVEASQIQDATRRIALYTQVQKTVVQDVGHVLLNHQVPVAVVDRKVKAFHLHPNLNFIFSETSMA